MLNMNKQQKEYIIKLLQEDKELPHEFKYLLFPTKQKEYELVYAGKIRKEDLLANEDGVFPVPLQIDKVFNGDEHEAFKDDWKNMIVFGDNLQFLKTVYENKDPLIKNKVKGKVKLIYIDPPFGTGAEYEGNKGQRGYSAKRKGSDFVEFVRKRLIIAKEILANDGVIFVRQGYNFGHNIRIILDEVFGKPNFINEIIVNRGKQRLGGIKKYSTATDTIYFYSKSDNYLFQGFKRERYSNEAKGTNMLMKGERRPRERVFLDPDGEKVVLLPPPNTHWKFIQPKLDGMYKKGVVYLAKSQKGKNSGIMKKEGDELIPVDYVPSFRFDDDKTIDSNWTDIAGYSQLTGYPTENSPELLNRIISTSTQKGDIILDFFAGSGTTAAVAEKLGRKWIVCDIGKLSYYTMSKRVLTIQDSKDLENAKKRYGKNAKNFITAQLGLYDIGKVFELQDEKYKEFVSGLFEVEIKKHKIAGFEFDGKKGEFPVKIFDYRKFKDSSVDEDYLKQIHAVIGKRVSGRVYVIAPANYVGFLTDYHEIDGLRYYFLKIPYQVIKELHKIPFQKLRQPQSKKNVNDLDEVIGFHFIRQPEVKSKIKAKKDSVEIEISEFKSQYYKDEEGIVLENFETLAMVLIDSNYNEKEFVMDQVLFADDLMPKKSQKQEDEEDIREELREQKNIIIPLDKEEIGNKIMIVYVDIYGNEFKEILNI
jgi:site-specific DNA-methyltransferase (adenine-specific)/adenine-specific DNA-methyltransferase